MYYLIRPDLKLEWFDISKQTLESVLRKNPVDLGQLQWDPADRPFDFVTLRLALRQGIACSKGIAVAGTDLVPLDHLARLLEIKSLSSVELPGEDLMEALMPGWKKETARLNATIDESRRQLIEEAQEELTAALAKSASEDLVAHWSSIGGVLPSPV
ncbi:hypothetical protein DW322_03370 [Rhodococcus rhodnii]|uniref:Uncharacterized protein n=2 Tax=Rhodococcus rhodnii TaxID=38312 RepID=R7WHG6_9NOCA|nr:hypothetical protein [Rhodococcus rhodnii]EOM74605.1 hypothetical protein Rrhod_4080 [Rhodococcus rhodnii LMG 5362]TXG89445.1 hypothetical protein DW322_03370 [Rhodococcus rhodnii]